MKLDVSVLRFMTKEEFRILTAIEMGMRNHEVVPTPLIESLARLTRGGTFKAITNVHKNKLIFHDAKNYDGYRLNYAGYDYLALHTFSQRGSVTGIGTQIGVGKEADIYTATNADGKELVIKFQRLGRTSFRNVKQTRDYLGNRKTSSWLYLSRLGALKEYAYMKALHEKGYPVPEPIDWNRHSVVMSRVNGYPLTQVTSLRHPGAVFDNLMNLIIQLARYGLVHCDFNEFNIMISNEEEITVIDFPQMISTSHINAEMFFDRDVNCIRTFFEKRFDFISERWPKFSDYREREFDLDILVEASGFTKQSRKDFDEYVGEMVAHAGDKDDTNDNDDNDDLDDEQLNANGEKEDKSEHTGEKDTQADDDDENDDDEDDDSGDDDNNEDNAKTTQVSESGRKKDISTSPINGNIETSEKPSAEKQQQSEGDEEQQGSDEEEDAVKQKSKEKSEYIRKKVKRSLDKKGKQKTGRNVNKVKSKKVARNVIPGSALKGMQGSWDG